MLSSWYLDKKDQRVTFQILEMQSAFCQTAEAGTSDQNVVEMADHCFLHLIFHIHRSAHYGQLDFPVFQHFHGLRGDAVLNSDLDSGVFGAEQFQFLNKKQCRAVSLAPI